MNYFNIKDSLRIVLLLLVPLSSHAGFFDKLNSGLENLDRQLKNASGNQTYNNDVPGQNNSELGSGYIEVTSTNSIASADMAEKEDKLPANEETTRSRLEQLRMEMVTVINNPSLSQSQKQQRFSELMGESKRLEEQLVRDRIAANDPKYKSSKEVNESEKGLGNLFVRRDEKKTVLISQQGLGDIELKSIKIGQPFEQAKASLEAEGFRYNKGRREFQREQDMNDFIYFQTVNVVETAGLVTSVRLALKNKKGRLKTDLDIEKVKTSAIEKYGNPMNLKSVLYDFPKYITYRENARANSIAQVRKAMSLRKQGKTCKEIIETMSDRRACRYNEDTITKIQQSDNEFFSDPESLDISKMCEIEGVHGLCRSNIAGVKWMHDIAVPSDTNRKQLLFKKNNDYIVLLIDTNSADFRLYNAVVSSDIEKAAENRTSTKMKSMDLDL